MGLLYMGVLLIFIFSCSSRTECTGLYKAQEGEYKKFTETYIKLNKSGEGTWRVSDDLDTFSWYVKGDQLRLNTKSGGVIVGQIQNDTIVIVLADREKIIFKKTKE